MKKTLIALLCVCSLLVVGCGKDKESEENYVSYEWHFDDVDFKHTEEIEAKYDKDGNFKKLEVYYVYYEMDKNSCKSYDERYKDAEDLKYKGVKTGCEIVEEGPRIYAIMTDESVKDGYMSDEVDYDLPLHQVYDKFKDEESAKEAIQSLIDMYKEEGYKSDDRNYAIMAGEKINW